jgi:CHAD domain-containing protein
MTFRFKLQEPIAEGLQRIGLEQVDIAAAKLAGKEDPAAAIHDARRCLKRLRALLRLVRPGLADATYARESERLAGIGRMLAGARDLHVMQQTLGRLETRFGPLPNGAADHLRKLLARGRTPKRRSAGLDARRQALSRLEQARRLFQGRTIWTIELDHIIEGLETTYRKARKAFRHAYRDPTDEAFHAWRKKVQQHWRHMSLLSRGWPEAMSARASEAKELSRLLGEDHDLAVLLGFAGGQADKHLELGDLEALTSLCRACQAELRAEAKPRAERLFAERPDDLREHVRLYWTTAASLAALKRAEVTANGSGVAESPGLAEAAAAPDTAAAPPRQGRK